MDQTAEERLFREHLKASYSWVVFEQQVDFGDHRADFLIVGSGPGRWGSVIVEIDDPSHWRPKKFERDTTNAIFHLMRDRIYTVRIDNRDILKHVDLCVVRVIETAAAWAAVLSDADPKTDLAQVLKVYNANRTPPSR